MLPRLPSVYLPVNPLSDLARLVDVSGALEVHRLEDYEPLRVPVVLPDSRELRGKFLDKVVPNLPARRVIFPSGHYHKRSPSSLTFLVDLDPPTEVRSIVGVHPVSVDLHDPPVLPCGYVPRHIPCSPPPRPLSPLAFPLLLSFSFRPLVGVFFALPSAPLLPALHAALRRFLTPLRPPVV